MVGTRSALTSEACQRFLVGVAFLVASMVGVRSAADFGVSWDEPDYYHYGDLVQTYYRTGDRAFEEFSNLRYYGAATPLLHASVADLVDPEGPDRASAAHLVNYGVFLGGAAALYLLIRLQTGSRLWGLLGAAVLLLSPRIFSHAFVNPKDSPFLALTTVTIAILVHYIERRQRWMLWALGVVGGLLVGIRVTGLMIAGLAIVALRVEAWVDGTPEARDRWARDTVRYVGVLVMVAMLTWPYLWPNPPLRFAEALSLMTSFTVGPQEMLYLGDLAEVASPPWHYVPVWIGVTTPPVYLLLAAFGILTGLAIRPTTAFRTRAIERHHFLYAIWLFGPVLLVVIGRSALYDEWRHVNFVYPAFVIFVVLGARWIWTQAVARHGALGSAFVVVVLVSIASIGKGMADDHPYQAVYFNELAGRAEGAYGRFELDYWGLSYKEGLELIRDEVPVGVVRLHTCTPPAIYNAEAAEGGDRFEFVDRLEEADFSICAPREGTLLEAADEGYLPDHPDLGTVRRGGVAILWVKDLRDP